MNVIINVIIRLPIILRRSYNKAIVVESFRIPGWVDSSLQCVVFYKLVATYKGNPSKEEVAKWEKDMVLDVKSIITNGQVHEDEFEAMGYHIDTGSDNVEHPLRSFCHQGI